MSKQKPNKKPKSEKSENQILNSPIKSFSEVEVGLPSPFFTEDDVKDTREVYTIDDLIDVWCRGCTNGATLWQYCQDTNRPLPTSFEAGLIELVNEVRTSGNKSKTLQDFVNNNMILLGVFEEKQ